MFENSPIKDTRDKMDFGCDNQYYLILNM